MVVQIIIIKTIFTLDDTHIDTLRQFYADVKYTIRDIYLVILLPALVAVVLAVVSSVLSCLVVSTSATLLWCVSLLGLMTVVPPHNTW